MSNPTWPDDLLDFAKPDAAELPPELGSVVNDLVNALTEGMPHCSHELQARMLQQHIDSDHRLIDKYHRLVCHLLRLAGGSVVIPDSFNLEFSEQTRILETRDEKAAGLALSLVHK